MSQSKGFTLIELLVVTTVVILFAGASLAYYNNFTTGQQLLSERKKMMDVLTLAKQKSNSADLDVFTCPNFSGYKVIAKSTTSYELQLCCSNACSGSDLHVIQPYTSNSVTSDLSTVQFKPLGYGTYAPADQTITLTSSSGSSAICVRQSGLIEEDACQ